MVDLVDIQVALGQVQTTLGHQASALKELATNIKEGYRDFAKKIAVQADEVDALQIKIAAQEASNTTLKRLLLLSFGACAGAVGTIYIGIQNDHADQIRLRSEFEYHRSACENKYNRRGNEGKSDDSWQAVQNIGTPLGEQQTRGILYPCGRVQMPVHPQPQI